MAQYVEDQDGLPSELVGPWAKDKLRTLANYVQISSAARRKYLRSDATYIDLFCGSGRSVIRDTGERIEGSPLVAYNKAQAARVPFTGLYISDADERRSHAAYDRLHALGAPVMRVAGDAEEAARRIVAAVNPAGLHFAFLDPYNIGALSFSIFRTLAQLRRIDILVHVSIHDLQRNTDRYSTAAFNQFDNFVPGWRAAVDIRRPQNVIRSGILSYWSQQVAELGLPRAEVCELVTGEQQQRLYWLMFLSRSPFAKELWKKISSEAKQPTLFGAA